MKTNEQKELGVNQLSGEKKTSKSNITNIHIQSKEDLSMKYKYLLLKGLFQEKKKCSWKLKKKKSDVRNEETQQKCWKVMLGKYLRK